MALSEDQKAMLRLLAQRGEQGYEDLSALLGISVDQVHAKAREAAAKLEAEGIPAPTIPPPPGGADPGEESVKPQPPAEPRSLPTPPPEPVKQEPAPKQTTPKSASPLRSGFELPSGIGARAAIAAGALAVVGFVLILLLSGGDGSGETASDASTETPASKETASEAANSTPNLTQAVLRPVDGSDAEGRVIFGRIKKNVILQVQAEGLEPSPKGSSYTVWLYKSPQLALRVGSVKVTKSGGIAAQFPLPTELLAAVAGGVFDQVDISLASDAAYRTEIAKAKKEERLPAYTGEDILRGPISGPAIEAAGKASNE
jgi:hypothetical protein